MSVAAAELFLTSHLRLGGAPLSRGPWTAHYTLHVTECCYTSHITHYTLHVTPFVTYWDITCSLQGRTLHQVMRYEGSINKYSRKLRIYFKGVKFILCFLNHSRRGPPLLLLAQMLHCFHNHPPPCSLQPSPAQLPPAPSCPLLYSAAFNGRISLRQVCRLLILSQS